MRWQQMLDIVGLKNEIKCVAQNVVNHFHIIFLSVVFMQILKNNFYNLKKSEMIFRFSWFPIFLVSDVPSFGIFSVSDFFSFSEGVEKQNEKQ